MAQEKKKAARKKVAKKKPAARRKVTKKAAKKKAAKKKAQVTVTAEERHRMIAECAYYRAINTGPRSPEADRMHWLDAEKEIDALIHSWSD